MSRGFFRAARKAVFYGLGPPPVVRPSERTFASGVTNLTRNLSWAAASSVAGVFMQKVAFSAPLLLGGSLKILYDLLLYRSFRHVAPPEEL